jgi:hypothetical protein
MRGQVHLRTWPFCCYLPPNNCLKNVKMASMMDRGGCSGISVGAGVSVTGVDDLVGDSVAEAAGDEVAVAVGGGTGVDVALGAAVLVGILTSVGIALAVAVDVIVGLAVDVLVNTTSRQIGHESALPSGSRVWSYSS